MALSQTEPIVGKQNNLDGFRTHYTGRKNPDANSDSVYFQSTGVLQG